MKIRPSKSTTGHALVVTLVIAVCIGISLAAYLSLIRSQTSFAARGQTWNTCMAICEAGVDEALAHLNNPANTNLVLASDGWSWNGTGFTKQRNIDDDYFVAVIVTNVAPGPVITCTGFVVAPVNVTSSGGFLAAAAPQPKPPVQYIARVIRATTRREPQFPKALVAKMSLDFNGNNILVDSYNSKIGPYNPLIPGDKGDVALNNDINNAGNIGNANIKGHLSVGPNATVKIGPNGSVGSVGWHLLGKKGIEPGWLRKDMNVLFPDVEQPWKGGAFPPPSDLGNGWDYVLQDGNFEVNNFTLASGQRMYVKGQATLWVKGNLNISGYVRMLPDAFLRIYVSKGVVLSATWEKAIDPVDLIVYGLPSCKNIEVTTGARFPGVIYAPQAEVKLSGGANFFGSMVANTVVMSGNSAFHYDEALANMNSFRGFIVTGWQEL